MNRENWMFNNISTDVMWPVTFKRIYVISNETRPYSVFIKPT